MCARCDHLEERVAWLESELGLAEDHECEALIVNAFEVSPREAIVLKVLFKAPGRVLPAWVISEALPPVNGGGERDPEIVDVFVHRIRKRLGREIIETVRCRGYRLSDGGRERVRQVVGVGPAGVA